MSRFEKITKMASDTPIASCLKDERGVSALEFALLGTFLSGLYLGTAELSFLMEEDRRLMRAATAIGDLATRQEILDEAALDELHYAARLVIEPADLGSARIRMSALIWDVDKLVPEWSVACNWSRLDEDTPVDVPDNVAPQSGSGLLMTEIELDTSGAFDVLSAGAITLSETVYSVPRMGATLPLQSETLADTYVCPSG